jgi:hypothetical protein
MSGPETIQIYLMTLSVIQPARIQDIEKNAPLMFGDDLIREIGAKKLRGIHTFARENGLVVSVRRGSYCVSRHGRAIIRHRQMSSQIDNRRLFLMKRQRKGFN